MGWGQARGFLIIAIAMLFLSGAQNALVDASANDGYRAASILAAYPADIVSKTEAKSWAYRGREASNGPAYKGAASFAAAPTNFWHWSRFWQHGFLALGALCLFWCGYYWPINLRTFGRIGVGVAILITGHAVYVAGYSALWEHALPNASHHMAKTSIKLWVDAFIRLHSELEVRGILG